MQVQGNFPALFLFLSIDNLPERDYTIYID